MKTKITITIDSDLLKKIQQIAIKDERSISGLINKIIKDFMNGK